MKAMQIDSFGTKLNYVEIPDPTPEYGEVVLKVEACGICTTDLKIVAGTHPNCNKISFPFTPGHEICGRVEQIGEGVSGWKVGDRAIVSIYMGCTTCDSCRNGTEQLCEDDLKIIGFTENGGYAEKVRVRARNLVPVSDKLPAEEVAVVTDALTTCYRAAYDIGKVEAGERALVVGLGGLGIHLAQLLKVAGLNVTIVEPNAERLKIAEEFDFDTVFCGYPEDMPANWKFNVIFEITGKILNYDTLLSHMKRSGRFVMVSYSATEPSTFMSSLCHVNEIQLLGTRGGSYKNMKAVLAMVEDGLIKPIVAKTRPLCEANELLEELKAGVGGSGRLVLIP